MVSLVRDEFEWERKDDGERRRIADWWVLVTRPLGMAPREPLDDAETMRD